jgi:2-polyprenyl-6-methoxyphenol hydroxylase-like FAD-dependent oxidoreductase
VSVRGDHAIVIGGSVSGCPTAKVLSEFFDRVTVVDRDDLPEHAEHHRGVPQSPHLHGLLYGGRLTIDEIFDDRFTDSMRAAGGLYFDWANNQAFRFPEGWTRRAPGDLMVIFATRWTMEHVIRDLARRESSIDWEVGQVVGFTTTEGRSRVTGVTLKDGRTLKADLVVDAAGRASKSPKWVEEIGFQAPEESYVRSFLGYATVYGHLPQDAWPGDILSIAAPPFPGTTRGGFVVPQENGLVGIMAAGQSRDYPPTDKAGFTEFLRTAISPLLGEMWEQLEPETEIRSTKTSHNRLVRWHELERRPRGFLAIGEAVAAFNPVYGQGITIASLQAKALRQSLNDHDDLDAVVDIFPARAKDVWTHAWTHATDADCAFEGTEIENLERTEADAETSAYLSKVRLAATLDAYVAQAFFRAQGSMQGELLFEPELKARVEQVCTDWDEEPRDLSRPPEWADAEAPAAA